MGDGSGDLGAPEVLVKLILGTLFSTEQQHQSVCEAMNLALDDQPCPALGQAIAEITSGWKHM